MLANLGWLFVLAVLAFAVIPFRIGRWLRETRFTRLDLALAVLVVVVVLLRVAGC